MNGIAWAGYALVDSHGALVIWSGSETPRLFVGEPTSLSIPVGCAPVGVRVAPVGPTLLYAVLDEAGTLWMSSRSAEACVRWIERKGRQQHGTHTFRVAALAEAA